MKLSTTQQAMLNGEHGWPASIAMRMLAAVGKALDAHDLIPVSSAHLVIDGTALAEAGRDFLEKLVDHDARFAIPASINAIAVDRNNVVTSQAASDQMRMLQACEKMGALPSCSCNPFIQGIRPGAGESIAWSESATAPFVNGVIGARTNREGATALASALTGLTPRYGMHIDENRHGQLLFALDHELSGPDEYSLLGAVIGRTAGTRIPVIEGIQEAPTTDELVAFSASLAIYGEAAMFHMVGVTPEASSRSDALGGRAVPEPTIIRPGTLEKTRRMVGPARDGSVDVISIGCPHASLDQLREVASAAGARQVATGVRFYIHTNRAILHAAGAEGTLEILRRTGIRVTTDNCAVVSYERLPNGVRLATNSAKMALFAKSVSNAEILFGSAEQCIAAGLTGHWSGAAP